MEIALFRLRFLPHEAKFFDLFEQASNNLLIAAERLQDLVDNYQDVGRKAALITECEHIGDHILHQIIEQLHKTFITPLDREDITLLTHSLDDMLDFIEGSADMMRIYRIEAPTLCAQELAQLIVLEAREVNTAIPYLRHRARLKELHRHCVEINRLENRADDILQEALGKLFDDPSDIVGIIKWREIYELMESATDRGEDIANALEAVALKYA